MGLFDSIKEALGKPSVTDEAYYEAVGREIAEGHVRPGLWVKALADSKYDEPRAKARYIELRVEALKSELGQAASADRAKHRMLADEQSALKADALPAYNRGDYETALRGFVALDLDGQSWAQNYLGYMYEYGKGVTRDINVAVNYYKKAADQNNGDAQFHLGRLILQRNDSYQIAESWFSLAERNGHPDAARMKRQAAEFVMAQKRLTKLKFR